MKERKIAALILIITALVIVSVVLNMTFSFYRQYRQNVNYLNQQNKTNSAKLEELAHVLQGLGANLGALNAQFSNNGEALAAIWKKVDSGEAERKGILAQVGKIDADLVSRERNYGNLLNELNAKVEGLKAEVEAVRSEALSKREQEIKRIDLGKISVEHKR